MTTTNTPLDPVRVIREALEFYANEDNYISEHEAEEYREPLEKLTGLDVSFTIIDATGKDRGEKARAALSALQSMGWREMSDVLRDKVIFLKWLEREDGFPDRERYSEGIFCARSLTWHVSDFQGNAEGCWFEDTVINESQILAWRPLPPPTDHGRASDE